MAPATSSAIAERAGLTERYVREWLGAMVCGGIVEYEPSARTYRLPPEHALLLTGQSSRKLVTLGAIFPLLTRVVPDVVKAFQEGGGVPHAAYEPDFAGLMDGRSRPRYEEFLLSKYLGVSRGAHPRLEAGIRVGDIGCSTGYAINLMARRFPRSTFVGYDFSEMAIVRSRAEAAALGVANAVFEVQDVSGRRRCGWRGIRSGRSTTRTAW
jgi:hypothetical protein